MHESSRLRRLRGGSRRSDGIANRPAELRAWWTKVELKFSGFLWLGVGAACGVVDGPVTVVPVRFFKPKEQRIPIYL
jgi:hypothetical protein